MTMLLPQQPVLNRCNRSSTVHDQHQLAERFWEAVQLDSPTSQTFDPDFCPPSPIDEKVVCVVNAEEATPTTTTFLDDPIVAFETLDCYSPDRATFTPLTPAIYEEFSTLHDPASQPCPHGEPPLGLCTSPAPTMASIRYHNTKTINRTPSPESSFTLRPTRFQKATQPVSHNRTNVLTLASAFLDSIVRLTRTRSSTPTMTDLDGHGTATILESEVLINVLEDGKRAGLYGGSTSLCGGLDGALEKLEIPPLSAPPPLSTDWEDPRASPLIASAVDGLASSAWEVDAVGKLGWERQLSRTKAHGFEAEESVIRGRDVLR